METLPNYVRDNARQAECVFSLTFDARGVISIVMSFPFSSLRGFAMTLAIVRGVVENARAVVIVRHNTCEWFVRLRDWSAVC